jgi:AcrR family transcriptional regulator
MTTKKDTREKILESALALFRERGFAEATMREIAGAGGVAIGLAYYYFDSKDAIVLAFYQQAQADLTAPLAEAHKHRTLGARLEAIVLAKFKYFEPNRRFLGALMAHAADPASPLSPFGEPSREIREQEFAQFDRALVETRTSIRAIWRRTSGGSSGSIRWACCSSGSTTVRKANAARVSCSTRACRSSAADQAVECAAAQACTPARAQDSVGARH